MGKVNFAIRGKKEWQNNIRLFCLFGYYFAVDLVLFCLSLENGRFLIYMRM